MAKIALCLTGADLDENRRYLNRYQDHIDLAELRVDCLHRSKLSGLSKGTLSEFIGDSPVPLILTIRRSVDGGHWDGCESERLILMEKLIPLGFAYADLEDDLGPEAAGAEKAARDGKVRIIRSLHDFRGIPEDLVERMKKNGRDGALPKAAVTLTHSREIIPFLEAARELEGQEKILLAMGERGFFSRIMAERLGSFLTFTSPAEGQKGAAGQIDPVTLEGLYRFRKVTASDPLYGIIGNPVIQSRSPELHNRWLDQRKLPGVYIPFLLDGVDHFDRLDQLLDIRGLSVTIPFKEAILPFIDKISPGVRSIGACNTYYKREGRVLGENSDALGFLYPLLDRWGIPRDTEKPLRGVKCSLIGAGGASRGVLFALVSSGARVLVLNRTLGKARTLAGEFGAEAAPLSSESRELIKEYSRLIVQTTSLGMAPMEERDPLEFYDFNGKEFLYDIIYKPVETVLMKRAARAGCGVLGGWEMLREQGKVQFELFTGMPVPTEKP